MSATVSAMVIGPGNTALSNKELKVRDQRLHAFDSRRVPLTRRYAPTSPRKRGEVRQKNPRQLPAGGFLVFQVFRDQKLR